MCELGLRLVARFVLPASDAEDSAFPPQFCPEAHRVPATPDVEVLGVSVKPEYETAARYLHGGDVVLVPAEVAAWLLTHSDLTRLRTATRGADPRRDAVLLALTMAAHRHAATSATGSDSAAAPEVDSSLQRWMSTKQAGQLVGLSDRAVRYACESGRLAAQKVAGRYRISRSSLNQYRHDQATLRRQQR